MSDRLAVIQAEESVRELKEIEAAMRELIPLYKQTVTEINKINRALNTGKLREYTDAMKRMREETTQFVAIERQLSDAMMRVARLEAQQARTALENARARRESTIAIREESRTRIQLDRETRRNENSLNDNTSAYKRFSKEVLEAKNKAKNLGAEMILLERDYKNGVISTRDYNTQMGRLSREFVEARTRALGLHEQIRRLDASVGDNQRNVGNYRSALNGLATSFRSLIGALGVASAIDMFADLIRSSFATIKILDAQNVALKQIYETQNQVAFQQQYLTDIADRYGLQLVSTTASYTKYSAAVKDTALEGENARKIFSSFSGASAKLGLNADAQTGIFRALEQMISKGTVQAEELRGQLGDRMPGAFKLFADAAGVSTRELGNMLKKGDVLTADILPKVAARLDEVYSLNKSEKIDTVVAAQNRLSNAWTSFLNQTSQNKEILNGLAEGMEGLGNVMNFLLDTLIVKGTDGVSVVGDLIEIIKSLYDAVTGMAESLGIMNEKTKNSLFSMNQFKNDLKSMQAVISVVTGTVKALAETISAFFETMFQDDGWNKFTKRFEAADKQLKDLYQSYNKTQDGIIAANKKGMLYNNELDPHIVAWKKAREAKLAYFQLNGKYFDTKTGRNTGKSLDDYIDVGDKLVKKQKSPIDLDLGKKEKYKASKLTGEQRDHLKDLQATRDLALAINETSFIKGQQDEREYLNALLNIENDYYNKKISYLKGNNAEERKQRADAILDQKKKQKEVQEKVYNIDADLINENIKKKKNILDRESKALEDSDFISSVTRIDKQIDIDNQSIQLAQDHYAELIQVAKNANQKTIDLERKRDEEIGAIEDKRQDKYRSRYEAAIADLNTQSEFTQGLQNLTYGQQRSVVLANHKLSIAEKEYLLNILDKDNQININKIEIERLKTLRSQLLVKIAASQVAGFINPNDVQEAAKLDGIIKGLENANIEIDIDKGQTLSPALEKTKEIISQGLSDLGLQNLSDQFDDVFKKIVAGTFSAKDAALLAASAIADGLTAITNKTKDNTIAALDEQLKYTQETTEQEIGFINQRLEQLNALETLTAEQMTERNRLEDEARTYKEQQLQREKMIEGQKARAEQKAAANQALINGALGASLAIATYPFPASLLPAGLALAFGVAQSIAISSKDVVPKYRVGRRGGDAEVAITQDGGREFISNSKGEITSLGSDKGDQLTYLKKGDNVHTAKETKAIISRMGALPKLGDNLFQKIALQSLRAPAPVVINQNVDNSDLIAQKVGKEFDKALKRYDKPVILKKNGKIIEYRGANLGNVIGEYDENGNEKYYS